MKIITKITFIVCLISFFNDVYAQIPVSKKELNSGNDILRFAIVSDRTGGMETGIFDKAVDKLNLMQPEFVISVGDLIDGYTEDPKIWNAQWDEFDAMINRLEMPFYYVPGNHDVSNESLTEVWRKRHGRDYYSFIYKEVLFIALNTDEIKDGGMSDTQVDYVINTLKDNQQVKWTLFFMHRPLWSYSEKAGYGAIERALVDRKHTVFSGHHHNYQYQVKNGMDHYVLATTGGGSWRRGADVGEFDHITWVTIKDKEPEVAHIDINAIYDKNLIPPEDYDAIETLRRGNWLAIEPVIIDSESFTSVKINLLVKNDLNRTMLVAGTLPEKNGIVFEPQMISEKLNPGQQKIISVIGKSVSGEPIAVSTVNNSPIHLEINAGFTRDNKNDISLSASKRLFMDWKHPLKSPKSKIVVDGKIEDWPTENFITVKNPQYFLEDWDWNGADDGEFAFNVMADKTKLYIVVKFEDNKIISDTKNLKSLQDKFYIHINGQPKSTDYYQLEFAKGDKSDSPLMSTSARQLKGLKASVTKNNEVEILEFSVPLNSINADQSSNIRVNIGIMDHDRPENTKPSVLWWRPVWNSNASYKESSLFYR
ncbi:putative phosphodiesterase [Flavobacterium sp. PL11]|uniref:metallophosphoesterase family protein n=1 Tax=Flavobacterium sp. PL11 TaxID=3071717 RepID=UPI002DFDDD76|nr:putative phosphodiesterase [Flavobacterium sp. PL11]